MFHKSVGSVAPSDARSMIIAVHYDRLNARGGEFYVDPESGPLLFLDICRNLGGAIRQIANMTVGSSYDEILTQKLGNRARLSGRLYYY